MPNKLYFLPGTLSSSLFSLVTPLQLMWLFAASVLAVLPVLRILKERSELQLPGMYVTQEAISEQKSDLSSTTPFLNFQTHLTRKFKCDAFSLPKTGSILTLWWWKEDFCFWKQRWSKQRQDHKTCNWNQNKLKHAKFNVPKQDACRHWIALFCDWFPPDRFVWFRSVCFMISKYVCFLLSSLEIVVSTIVWMRGNFLSI